MLQFSAFRTLLVICVVFSALLVLVPSSVPSIGGYLPAGLQQLGIRLGLDLQGGSSLLLEIDENDVRKARMETLEGQLRTSLRDDNFGYRKLRFDESQAAFNLRDEADREAISALLSRQFGGINSGSEVISTPTGFSVTFSEERWQQEISAVIGQTIEVIRRRIDETGTNEPTIQQQGRLRILVQLPGLDDPERLKNLLGRTAKLNFHLLDRRGVNGGRAYPGSVILPMQDGSAELPVIRRSVVSGENLEDAQATFQDNAPVVSFRFNQAGGQRFGRVTSENVNNRLAIILDQKIISAPSIDEPILGGSGIIRGGFTVSEAQDLALLLRAGALPAPIVIVEERTVGPSLGNDSLEGGQLAAIIGLLAVAVLMSASYGIFGIMAIVALSFNILLLLAALSAIQATLTLPGIAGVALTIGMAVDANVLIFERIREELRNGKSPPSAINAGFERAFTTILDANITTLFAAGCLFIFGSGAIRGFSVTLSVGILTSMFSAIMMTRLFSILWYNWRRPRKMVI